MLRRPAKMALRTIDDNLESLDAVSVAGLIPANGHRMSVVGNSIEAKMCPVGWKERMNFQNIVVPGNEAAQASDYEVAERRVIVVLRATHLCHVRIAHHLRNVHFATPAM